jgi:hypothetical protein
MLNDLDKRVAKLEDLHLDKNEHYEILIIDKSEGDNVHIIQKISIKYNTGEQSIIDCDEWIEKNK